jgi:hypothetical protein
MSPVAALRQYWPEYLIEAAALAALLMAAAVLAMLLAWPRSPLHRAFPVLLLERRSTGSSP